MESKMYKRDIFGDHPCLTLELDFSIFRELKSFDGQDVRETQVEMYNQLVEKLRTEISYIEEEIYHLEKKDDGELTQ